MWEYTNTPDIDYLQHYGVLGMRWGIRRTPEQLRRAANKMQNRNTRQYDRVVKAEARGNTHAPKVARLQRKAAKKRAKKYGFFTSKKRAEKLEWKAEKLEARAAKIETKDATKRAKAKKLVARINRRNEKISTFLNTANALESEKVLAGNRFFMRYERATVDSLYDEKDKK